MKDFAGGTGRRALEFCMLRINGSKEIFLNYLNIIVPLAQKIFSFKSEIFPRGPQIV